MNTCSKKQTPTYRRSHINQKLTKSILVSVLKLPMSTTSQKQRADRTRIGRVRVMGNMTGIITHYTRITNQTLTIVRITPNFHIDSN
jgi:hypothetical protein